MNFNRHIFKQLGAWKTSKTRKPLILRGARQVGKSTLVAGFAEGYQHSILLNLEKPAHRAYFDDFDEVKAIAESLLLANKIPFEAMGETLLFIDEIQESPKAIQLLRYFYEEIPELHVIAAGSLMEFAMKKVQSFPVGRVDFLYVHPLNFSEYLQALGHEAAHKQLQQIPIKASAHKVLLGLFHRYIITGGMPEVVRREVEKSNLADLPNVYESIWQTYKNDVEKYSASDTERKVIMHVMGTAPFYVDQRIKFERFGNSNYRSREIGGAMRTLEDARILRLIYPTTDMHPPIKPDLKKSPRLQFLDTGLVNHTLGIQHELLGLKDFSGAHKGAIIPHLITQEMMSIATFTDHKPNFWVREKKQSSSEVDLVYAYKNFIIPIEIKSGSTGSLKSLHQFVEAADHPYAIRFYGGEFGVAKAVTPGGKPYTLLNLPYYLGTRIGEWVEWLVEGKH